jgi:mono/diheme cytochrome c family protein
VQATGANPAPQGWPTFKESGLYEGKQIYASHCLTCHGCAGNGLGTYGGTLVVTPVNFKQDPFKDMPDDQWFWHVSEGVQGSVMPPWRQSLSVDQRWKVVRYVQLVYAHAFEHDPNEGDVPKAYDKKNPLDITIANIDAGKRIWTRECQVCHGDAARGEGIYRQGIEPVPPNFDAPANYNPYTDSDYFWRVSEGVPWTAMPTWKLVYNETERWQLVTYIRTMFTQTVKAPPQPREAKAFASTPVMRSQTIPKATTFLAGRQQFIVQCAHCHGLAGDGKGWDGAYLNPKPANLQVKLKPSDDGFDGKTFSKVTSGMMDSAMPIWGEFLTTNMRWADVKYVKDSFNAGPTAASNASHYGTGAVALPYVRTDPGIFQSEIATIQPAAGAPIWAQYCSTCHGADGKGKGPGTKNLIGGGPAPLPSGMNNPYIFSTIRGGLPGTMMYGFQPLLSETDIWNVTAFTVQLTGGKWGG